MSRHFFLLPFLSFSKRPGDGKETPVQFPDPKTSSQIINNYSVLTLSKLIELKLASYKRLPSIRMQDKSDVSRLIEINKLDRSFADSLHPYVKKDFEEMIDLLEIDRKKMENKDEE